MSSKNHVYVGEKFHGFKVVIGCFFLLFFAMSIVGGTSALMMAPICEEFNFLTSQYSIMNLIGALMGAISAVILAPHFKKGKAKQIIIVCSIICSLSYMMMGQCNELWQFFLVNGIANFALGGIGQLPVSYLITTWFDDKRSLAMSIAFCGGGLGGTIWSILFGAIISNHGWRYCYYLGGVIVLISIICVATFLIKSDPYSYNQKPYKKSDNLLNENDVKKVILGVDKKVATKTKSFYALIVVMFLLGLLSAGVATHAINYLMSVGWEMSQASKVLSLFSLISIAGMLFGGILFEKLGIKGGTFISIISAVLGLIFLMMAKNMIFGYLYAIFFSLAMMLPRMLPAMIVSDIFGVKDYASIYSYLNIYFLVGCALGSLVTGIINDMFGYSSAWIFYIITSVLLFVFTCLSISYKKYIKLEEIN